MTFVGVRIICGFFWSYEFWQIFAFGNPKNVDISCYSPLIIYPTVAINGAFYLLNLYWGSAIFKAIFTGKAKQKVV